MFSRKITKTLKRYAKFPVIALLGPRQSGKTTIVKFTFPKHTFLTMDKEETRTFATEDPEGFLHTYENKHGLILDEFQYVPKLASYIKLDVDKKKRPGYFILTGSQNFLLNQAITESLAGRVGILNLLPLSLSELLENDLASSSLNQVLINGGYPRLYDEKFLPSDLYPFYIQSYIERDVRQLLNVGNLSTFQRFIQLCAGRIGQLLNIDALAVECGVTFPTAKQWLSILEASYILFLLQPHFNNFNKRLVKTPKLYFFDTGIACSLLRITSPEILALSPFRGHLFESLIISDLYKQYCNAGMRPSLYFWRDKRGTHEIDCIIDEGLRSYPIEIKSGMTITSDFFKGIEYWTSLADGQGAHAYLIYAGSEVQKRNKGNVIGWKDSGDLLKKIVTSKRTRKK